jgi:hypothetical protein
LTPGSLVTLYGCWGWNGSGAAATVTYAGVGTKLTLGNGITSPSSTTLQNLGTAVADANGTVSGSYANGSSEGQVGGMIFEIKAPVSHSVTVLPSGVTNICGASASFIASAEAGATFQWYDNHNAPIFGATSATLTLTNLHPANSGTYEIVASGSGWSATNSVVVSITDSAAPVMTLNGASIVVLMLNSAFTDPGATAWDTCAGAGLTVTTSGVVNTTTVGEYPLTYSATTGSGTQASVARTVIVIDSTIQPDVLLSLDLGPYTDPWSAPDGFTKILAGGLSSGNYTFPDPTGIGSGLTLSFTNVGAYSLGNAQNNTISTDGFYNFGNQPAQFTLSGLAVGTEVTIYAVYAWGGNGQGPVIIYGGATNRVTAGITTSTPTIADFQQVGTAIASGGTVSGSWYGVGGPATEGQIGGLILSVESILAHGATISPALVAPQCGSTLTLSATVGGASPFTYQWYDNHNNLIASATTATLTLTDVRPAAVGTYTVIASNAYGSSTNSATITGIVDAAPPVLTLNGANPLNIIVSGTYVEPGATAYDLCSQTNVAVQITGTLDTSTLGTYTLTYSTTSYSGSSTNLTRTINVVPVPNVTLQLDFAPSNAYEPAPAGFTKVQNGPFLTVGNPTFPSVAGSDYTLSFTNVGSYSLQDTNDPLVTDGFYNGAGNSAGFTLSGLPAGAQVTLYAVWGWNGAGWEPHVYFGGTNVQVVDTGVIGANPTLANFTKIGSAVVDSSCAVSGTWRGPGAAMTQGQVGGMVFVVGPPGQANGIPVASDIFMGALTGAPASLLIIGGKHAPTDPDNDPLTVTAVQNPSANGGTVTTDGISVTYTSAGAFAGIDTFTYTVGNGRGGFATATVTVSVLAGGAGFNQVSGPTLTNGLCQIVYQGIPYAGYALETTTSLNPPVTWTPVVTNQANATGGLIFMVAPSQGLGFYRTRFVP